MKLNKTNIIDDTKYSHIIVFFFICIVLFVNASKPEIQPWDEGLYAYRAVSISNTGNYIDQTNESLAGLYSSTSPPFTHWMINTSTRVFGENALAIRLFSILCSLGSIILIYYISLKFISSKYAILSSLLLSSSLMWNQYSRQAMTDIPLISMFLLLLFIIIKYYESGKTHQILFYSISFAFVFSITLLTKIVISLFPLLFLFIYLLSKQKTNKKLIILISSIIGIALASPWYIYMSINYGAEFYNALFLPQISSAVENNSRQSGIFYYINSLVVSCPFIIFAFFYRFEKFNFKSIFIINSRKKFIYTSIASWFSIMFLVMTYSITKMPYYTNYILVPLIILAVFNIDKMKNITLNSRYYIFIFIITFLAFFWSFSFDFRQEIKLISKLHFSGNVIIVFAILITSLMIYYFTDKEKIIKFGRLFFIEGTILLTVFLISRIFFLNFTNTNDLSFGGEATIKEVKSIGADTLIYLFNDHAGTDSLNPQLEWYIYQNYKKSKKPVLIKYPISNTDYELDKIIKLDSLRNYPIIYYITNSTPQVIESITEIIKTRDVILSIGNYYLFTTKKRNRDKGLQI